MLSGFELYPRWVPLTSLKKASRKTLNPKSNARFPESLSNAARNFWLVSRWISRQ